MGAPARGWRFRERVHGIAHTVRKPCSLVAEKVPIMLRKMLAFVLLSLAISASGCAMCDSPYDYSYSAYGGTCCKNLPSCGRAGSVFTPPYGIGHSEYAVDEELVPLAPEE